MVVFILCLVVRKFGLIGKFGVFMVNFLIWVIVILWKFGRMVNLLVVFMVLV